MSVPGYRLTRRVLLVLSLGGVASPALANNIISQDRFNGAWVFNQGLSDNTDRQVEEAIKKAGGTVRRPKKQGKYRYKGGAPEQALYDHLAYDETFHFFYEAPEFVLRYEENFQRVFYGDGRSRTVSASGSGQREDYAFAAWDGETLYIEARVADGGSTSEVYSLQLNGEQLRVELRLKPISFAVPVEITRIFDRQQ